MKKRPESNKDYLDILKDLKALHDTPGGKRLIDALILDVVGKVNILSTQYNALTHTEMIAHCASIGEKLSIIRTLTRAEDSYKELEKEIKETLSE